MSLEITNFMGSVFLELESKVKMKQRSYNQRFNKPESLLNEKLKDMNKYQYRALELNIITELQSELDDWAKDLIFSLKEVDNQD